MHCLFVLEGLSEEPGHVSAWPAVVHSLEHRASVPANEGPPWNSCACHAPNQEVAAVEAEAREVFAENQALNKQQAALNAEVRAGVPRKKSPWNTLACTHACTMFSGAQLTARVGAVCASPGARAEAEGQPAVGGGSRGEAGAGGRAAGEPGPARPHRGGTLALLPTPPHRIEALAGCACISPATTSV